MMLRNTAKIHVRQFCNLIGRYALSWDETCVNLLRDYVWNE